MPELPEVEIVKRDLSNKLLNKNISFITKSNKSMRFNPNDTLLNNLKNEKIISFERKNKYILIKTINYTLVFHLGMSGQLLLDNLQTYQAKKHEHISIHINDENDKNCSYILSLVDPRRFGGFLIIDHNKEIVDDNKLFSNLGIEPFSNKYTFDSFKLLAKQYTGNTKQFLLDSSNICGIGNIYASEILFLSKVSPINKINKVSQVKLKKMFDNILIVLSKAIDLGGSSISDFVHTNGTSGEMQKFYNVYSRTGLKCNICNNKIVSLKQNGRTTFYCKSCQK